MEELERKIESRDDDFKVQLSHSQKKVIQAQTELGSLEMDKSLFYKELEKKNREIASLNSKIDHILEDLKEVETEYERVKKHNSLLRLQKDDAEKQIDSVFETLNRKFANIGIVAIDLDDLHDKIAQKELEMAR